MVPKAKMVRTYCAVLFVAVVTAMKRMQPSPERPAMISHLRLNLSASQQHATT